jgi:DeoR family transcriptional regulator, fructose operon transcriptional repressor
MLTHLNESGALGVPELSERLEVSAATVRRDLQVLAQAGQVQRVRGGAMVTPATMDPSEPLYQEKIRRNVRQKRAIAREAVRRVREGDVIALDSGSTTSYVAKELLSFGSLTVITTDIKIAALLADSPGIDVIATGGSVRTGLYSLIGPLAEHALSGLNAMHVFLGADAIDQRHGVTNANLAEVAIKRALLRCGRYTYLLADHTKFDRVSLAEVAPLAGFDEVISDDGLTPEGAERYRQLGASLTLVAVEE